MSALNEIRLDVFVKTRMAGPFDFHAKTEVFYDDFERAQDFVRDNRDKVTQIMVLGTYFTVEEFLSSICRESFLASFNKGRIGSTYDEWLDKQALRYGVS